MPGRKREGQSHYKNWWLYGLNSGQIVAGIMLQVHIPRGQEKQRRSFSIKRPKVPRCVASIHRSDHAPMPLTKSFGQKFDSKPEKAARAQASSAPAKTTRI